MSIIRDQDGLRHCGFKDLVQALFLLLLLSNLTYLVFNSAVGTCNTVKLHKRGPLLQTAAGHPFPLLLGQPSSAVLSTAQAGGPPSVEISWATETIIFEDVRGYKITPFFTCEFSRQFEVLGIFSAHLYSWKLSEIRLGKLGQLNSKS